MTSSSYLFNPGTLFWINFDSIKAPPSTQITNPILVQVIRNGGVKMEGVTSIKVMASGLMGTVEVGEKMVNRVTDYRMEIIINDGLSSSGMI
jgi:endonuclease V-like protein UPF0215 family